MCARVYARDVGVARMGISRRDMVVCQLGNYCTTDVNRQIRELLDIGLIRPSVSPMASPIVCVAKKFGGVRIAGDYQNWNIFAVGDTHSTSKVQRTLGEIALRLFVSPWIT